MVEIVGRLSPVVHQSPNLAKGMGGIRVAFLIDGEFPNEVTHQRSGALQAECGRVFPPSYGFEHKESQRGESLISIPFKRVGLIAIRFRLNACVVSFDPEPYQVELLAIMVRGNKR